LPSKSLLWKAALVPLALLCGIGLSLSLHWPLYSGLMFGVVTALWYAKPGRSWGMLLLAARDGISRLWKVCVALLLIGIIVACWMDGGVIPELMRILSNFIRPTNLAWLSFLIATGLSMMIGSSIATWSIVGPPLMGLAPVHMAPLVAGAILSGGMVGDRASPMSTSVIVIANACDVAYGRVLRQLNLTALGPFLLALGGFFIASLVTAHGMSASGLAPGQVGSSLLLNPSGIAPWIRLLPPFLVIVLALARVPLLWNLGVASLIAILYASLFGLGHFQAVPQTVWQGAFMRLSGLTHTVGGLKSMVLADILIVAAGAFQGLTRISGCIDVLTFRLFETARGPLRMVGVVYVLCLLFAVTMGSQMLAVLMSGTAVKDECYRRGWSHTALVQAIGDAAELLPSLIPWNLLGLQAAIILDESTLHILPYAWFIWGMLLYSVIFVSVKTLSQKTNVLC